MPSVTLIANPRAGRGAVQQALPRVQEALEQHGLTFRLVPTERPGHATEIARAAVREGARLVVALGGDGTIHEVVNGMMGDDGPVNPDAMLGILPSGTGCDTAKTFGIPTDPVAAVRHLAGDRTWGRLDVGRIRYRTFDGQDASRWFINIAEAGIGAHVVAAAARMPAWLGGRVYRLAALRGIATFKPQQARLAMNGRLSRRKVGTPVEPVEHAGTVTMVVVANCQFFGGGLRVAPRAIPSDAMLDVLVGEGSKWDAVRALQKMPSGLHVPSQTISEYLVDRLDLDGPEPLLLEADGEPLGTTPATFDLVPAAIPLKI